MSSKQDQIRVLKLLQFAAPIPFVVSAALLYAFWDHDMKVIICASLLFMAVADIFVFKFLIDRAESQE